MGNFKIPNMDEEEDELQFSDCSDNESIEQSSGFVELSDREDENNSLKSESTTSTGKPRKRVTFQTEENLVLIREIPPRECRSDTDTTLESNSDSSSDSESDSDTGDLEEEITGKVTISKNSGISIKTTEIRQPSSRSLAKVAQITGAKLQQPDKNKNNEVKKTVKKKRRKQNTTEIIANKVTNKINKNAKATKLQDLAKPKTIKTPIKSDSKEVDTKNNAIKGKARLKEVSKTIINKNKGNTTRERPKSAPAESGTGLCSENCSRKNRSSDSNFITDADGIRCQCVSNAFWEIESDLSDRKHVDGMFLQRNGYGKSGKNGITSQNMHEFSSFHKLDMNVVSKTNKRLYSWLMANGNIPNPRDEAPCIAQMWDSSQSSIEESIIKAPT